MSETMAEIDLLIRSRHPILYIVSWEEDRVSEAVSRVAVARGKKLFVWTVDRGILPYGTPLRARSCCRPPATPSPHSTR